MVWIDKCFFSLLTHDHFVEPKTEKYKIYFLVTKRSQKLNPTRFSEPRIPHFGWCHFLVLTHDHFIKLRAKKRKNTVFGYKNFLIRTPKRFEICNFQAKSFGQHKFYHLETKPKITQSPTDITIKNVYSNCVEL